MSVRSDAILDTFHDVDDMLHDICHVHRKLHGGDRDELKAEANLHFMEAYHRHKPHKGKFSTWCYTVVKGGLLNRAAQLVNDNWNMRTHAHRFAKSPEADEPFDVYAFAGELSDDAQRVIRIALNPPTVVEREVGTRTLGDVLREFLSDMDWDAGRIDNVWTEIQEALA